MVVRIYDVSIYNELELTMSSDGVCLTAADAADA